MDHRVIVRRIRLFRFSLPLRRSIRVGRRTIARRDGVLLQLEDETGRYGYGEAAPLPGLHPETPEACVRELREIRARLIGQSFESASDLEKWASALHPASRFALDAALTQLMFALNSSGKNRVAVNALITGKGDEMLAQAQKAVAEGYRSLKIKVGRDSLEEELKMIRAILRETPSAVKLRLDANRSWTPDQAQSLEVLPAERIDYVEEPLQNLSGLEAFYRRTGLAIALDESLRTPEAERYLTFDGVKALVLKPTVLGGFSSVQKWAHLGQEKGKMLVLSDTFSSGIGVHTLGFWAILLHLQKNAHGLDTYRFLAEDVLTSPLRFFAGELWVGLPLSKAQIDWEKMEEL